MLLHTTSIQIQSRPGRIQSKYMICYNVLMVHLATREKPAFVFFCMPFFNFYKIFINAFSYFGKEVIYSRRNSRYAGCLNKLVYSGGDGVLEMCFGCTLFWSPPLYCNEIIYLFFLYFFYCGFLVFFFFYPLTKMLPLGLSIIFHWIKMTGSLWSNLYKINFKSLSSFIVTKRMVISYSNMFRVY